MKVIATALPDVKIIEPKVFGDHRGFFVETWNEQAFAAAGLPAKFVQDNHSRSAAGTLRGLHYQIEQTQGKLCRVVAGAVYDVSVDMRRSSPTFGKSVGVELSAENHRMLWVPPGFAHGFLVLSAEADFLYKCTQLYSPQHERTLLWNDPRLQIEWPLKSGQDPIMSAKDLQGRLFIESETFA